MYLFIELAEKNGQNNDKYNDKLTEADIVEWVREHEGGDDPGQPERDRQQQQQRDIARLSIVVLEVPIHNQRQRAVVWYICRDPDNVIGEPGERESEKKREIERKKVKKRER